jgi:glutathione synthase/RimK-type ligase-like ATP-grasp enzyme
MKTLLAVGDKVDFDSFNKFFRQRRLLTKQNILFKHISYKELLNNEFPKIDTKKVIVFFFFPFEYWDSKIETKKSKDVYGNKSFYIKFKKFWKVVKKKVCDNYDDKKVSFVNEPDQISTDRDKELTKNVLAKANIPISQQYFARDANKILEMLDQGKKLFIKVRFGSMGKGITYLEKGRWDTNFEFRGEIISKKSDYGWTFREVTDNKVFLRQLLKQDIIIEEAINPWLLKGRKFDLRLYVCFGKVLYIYPRSNDTEQVTTNISQGAKGEDNKFLNSIPEKLLNVAKKEAIRATKAMKLNFAGVDIMPNSDGKNVTVIELNTFPGFPKARRLNLSKLIINQIGKQEWK